jgi:hypothetical protein
MPAQNNYNIPDESIQPDAVGILSDSIAFAPIPQEEEKPFKISFEYYKDKKCGISNIVNKSHATKALNWLKEVGKCRDEEGIKSIPSKPTDDSQVYNANNYSFLFSGLPEEFSEGVREYKLSKDEGRIFYCVDAANKIVYCLLIHHAHLETDKNRR